MTTPDSKYIATDLAGRAAWMDNWNDKMQILGPGLGFTAAELQRINDDNEVVQTLATAAIQVATFTGGMTSYRRIMLAGDIGDVTPTLPVLGPIDVPHTSGPVEPGIWERLNQDIARVRKAPAYTEETGAELQIIPIETEARVEEETQPSLTVTTEPGYNVKVAGKMLGMDAIRIEYQRKGSDVWTMAAFLTKLPGEFAITPQTPGTPESGRIRAVYIKNSDTFGQYSPEYSVTVS